MSDQSSFRLAAALVFGGKLLYFGAGQFHPGSVPPNRHPEVFAEYANSAYWGAVHMGQFMGMACFFPASCCWRSPSPEGATHWIGWPA